MAYAHKRNNSIDSLEVDGNTIIDLTEIRSAIQNFYQILHKETEDSRLEFLIQDACIMSFEDLDMTAKEF